MAGCAQAPPPPSTASEPAVGPAQRTQGGTLIVVQERPTTLDPLVSNDVYSSTVANQIYVGLLHFGANLDPTPALAHTWTISPDGLHYVFDLRAGARFQNGRPVTAADVAYSLQRAFAPGAPANIAALYLASLEGAEAYHSGRAPAVSGIVVESDTRLRLRLSRRDPSFLWSLCLPQTAVVPKEVVESDRGRGLDSHPVGAGPFRLVTWNERHVVLAANRDYFGAAPHLDTLVFLTPAKLITEEGARMLLAGRAHLSEVRQSYFRQVAEAPDLKVLRRRELALGFVGVNCALPPLDHPKVREALACAIDRRRLVELDSLGASLAQSVLPPGMQCYSPSPKALPFDAERAARALAAAGYPGGQGLPVIDYWTHVRSPLRRLSDSLMVANLRRVGIRVRVREEEWPDLNRRIDDKRAALFSLSWVADIPDPDSFLGSLFGSRSTSNFFGYASAEVDSLLERARTESDPPERARLYHEVEARVLADGALIPLSHRASLYGVSVAVHGVDLTPLGISVFDFSQVWMDASPHAL